MDPLAAAFLDQSRHYLLGEYLPKIERCVERLPPDDLWWRPNEASNSVGNLILHLAGNARQWIVSGVGGADDVRERDGEFAAEGGLDGPALLAHLREAYAAVDAVLAGLDPAALGGPRTIQGYETTGFQAIYHVVEHASMHVGQIIQVTKQRTGRDLAFYRGEDGQAFPNW